MIKSGKSVENVIGKSRRLQIKKTENSWEEKEEIPNSSMQTVRSLNVTGVAITCQSCIPGNGNRMAISYADTKNTTPIGTTGNILASTLRRAMQNGLCEAGRQKARYEHLLFVHGTTTCYVTYLAGTITRVDNVIGALHGKRTS